MPIVTDDEDVSPRRASIEANSLKTLSSGEGARVTTRDNASEAADIARDRAAQRAQSRQLTGKNRPHYAHQQNVGRTSRKTGALVIAGVAALAVILAIVAVVTFANQQSASDETDTSSEPQQVQTTTEGTVTYMGSTFSIQQLDDGSYAIVAVDETGNEEYNIPVDGTPVTLILYNSVIVVPENLSDGTWDVVAFTYGGDNLPTHVVDSSGNTITGQGTITSATLDGSVLHIVDSTGATTDVSLE